MARSITSPLSSLTLRPLTNIHPIRRAVNTAAVAGPETELHLPPPSFLMVASALFRAASISTGVGSVRLRCETGPQALHAAPAHCNSMLLLALTAGSPAANSFRVLEVPLVLGGSAAEVIERRIPNS